MSKNDDRTGPSGKGKTKLRSLPHITDEEIGRFLDERPGGRIAGRGDSPWTQEAYEKMWGLDFGHKDSILSVVLNDGFYNFHWWLNCARYAMRPLVKKYSLARELWIMAAEIVIWDRMTGGYTDAHTDRVRYIIDKAVNDGEEGKYTKEVLAEGDAVFTPEERRKFRRQADIRLNNHLKRMGSSDINWCEDEIAFAITRDIAFKAAYLCLRTEDPMKTYGILMELIHQASAEIDDVPIRMD